MSTYKRFPVVLTRGLGVHVWDSEGRCYLDLVAGIAVCALGHAHPGVVAAIKEQAENLFHVSNLYHIAPQILLARLLVENSPFDKVFFCNSGAEANEAAIKLARKYASEHMPGKYELITMQDSFHGRTLATVTATAQERFHVGFAPLPDGFRYVPYNDLPALEAAVTEKTCGVLVEPIQGESGVVIPAHGYLQGIRRICDEKGLLMIADEVQTGIGRTGTLFACEQDRGDPGHDHAGEGPGERLSHRGASGERKNCRGLCSGKPWIDLRRQSSGLRGGPGHPGNHPGRGDPRELPEGGGIFPCPARRIEGKTSPDPGGPGTGADLRRRTDRSRGGVRYRSAWRKGLLINCTNGNVLRFVPPLILTRQDVDKAVGILDEVLEEK